MRKSCQEFYSSKIKRDSEAVAKIDKHSIETGDIFHVAVLVSISFVIGLFIIASTVLITQDGVEYISLAQEFSCKPIKVINHPHPFGYSFLIFLTHKVTMFSSQDTSVYSWIYSAQSVSLLSRILSLIPLYIIGKILVGPRQCFWGLLILIMLPYPAEFGSDVVREWPHILFLSTGLLFVILGARTGKWWMFGVAGLAAGFGHMIRPECAQVVIYGALWLLISLLYSRPYISRLKATSLTAVLLIGFAVPTAPYMKIRKRILPPKLKKVVNYNIMQQPSQLEKNRSYVKPGPDTASTMPVDILKAVGRLAQEVSDNLMYFFALPLVIGLYCYFRKIRRILFDERLFILALVTLYIVMMVLLYINYGYISRRHCMPMVVFTIFYIPVGVRIIARWLSEKTSKSKSTAHKVRYKWFFIILTAGAAICTAKLARITPLRQDKQGYLDAAKWLRENTGKNDIVAAADPRIAFYAHRPSAKMEGEKIPQNSSYVLLVTDNSQSDENKVFKRKAQKRFSVWVNREEKKKRIVIFDVP